MAEIEKAFLVFENHVKIECMFNPETLTVTRGNRWDTKASGPGRGATRMKYMGADNGSFDLDLWFDTTDTGAPVTYITKKLMQAMEVDKDLPGTNKRASNARPPWVEFHWGKQFVSYKSVITTCSVTFTYFSSDGIPLRAKATLALKQYEEGKAFGAQNPTSGTPRPHRVHRVQPGETLDRISARYYGDSTRWRQLAIANRVEDPLTIRPGSLLSVPELDGP